MSDELKLIAKRLTAVFAADPGATREALAAALPQAIDALAAIVTGKDYKAAARMKAIRELLSLQRRIVSEDLRRETIALKKRLAEVKIIEGRVAEIKMRVERDAEARRKRASLAKAVRDIKAAKRIEVTSA